MSSFEVSKVDLAYERRDVQRNASFWKAWGRASALYTLLMAILVCLGAAATSVSFTYLFDGSAWTIERIVLVLIHTMLVPILLTVGNGLASWAFFRESRLPGSGRKLCVAYAAMQVTLLVGWLFATTMVTAHLLSIHLKATSNNDLRYHACRWLSVFPTSLVGTATLWLACSLPILLVLIGAVTSRLSVRAATPENL